MKWPWSRPRRTHAEALERLAKLDEQDAEVAALAERLRETKRKNNFSGMVAIAIRRATREGH